MSERDATHKAGFDHPCKGTCSGWQQGYDRGRDSREHLETLFKEWETLLGPMPGVEIRKLLKERDALKAVLTKIRNSVAIASWNVKPEFRQWAKDCTKLIDDAVKS